MDDNQTNVHIEQCKTYPLISNGDYVIFPGIKYNFLTNNYTVIKALAYAQENDGFVFFATNKAEDLSDGSNNKYYSIGVICKILEFDEEYVDSGRYIVSLRAMKRAELLSIDESSFIEANVVEVDNIDGDGDDEKRYYSVLTELYKKYKSFFTSIDLTARHILETDKLDTLCDNIAYSSYFSLDDKIRLLSEADVISRSCLLIEILDNNIDMLQLESSIHYKVQQEIDNNQREYYLREEMKVISQELDEDNNTVDEANEYTEKINKLKCSDDIREQLLKEANKLSKTPVDSHEGTVIRSYLDKCLEIPFGKYTKDAINLEKSRKTLDRDHYGLDTVKERVIESLAVYKRNPSITGQIICLYGPPGVGKTSIVKSLSKSMNRKYVRISLGGISDEAEIRGHRRTYIGAMCGRIVDAVIKAGVMNPVILLDEIDKLGSDYKGDPAAALLEALDPEQNNSFHDHYIDFPIDLSRVMFITTANDTSEISPVLRDRMEIIELNSYTFIEKYHIARNFLLKKEMKKHKLTAREFKIEDDAYEILIDNYTDEAGVRSLEKQIATLCRKVVYKLENERKLYKITKENITDYLGPYLYQTEKTNRKDMVGVINGLAWTSVGGVLLPIEVSSMRGTGKLSLTGNLGDVMQESAKTAVSYVRSNADKYGIDNEFYKNKDIHIHAMEGAVPKDGPSAGMAITAAIVSELSGNPIKHDVAVTGEISLKGRILKIGGLREKSMAAYRTKCSTVVIPSDNLNDVKEFSPEVRDNIKFIPVENFSEAAQYIFEKPFN